jgi:phosphoglycerol transferase MdoB-like AlkP superfamily enzyme
MLIRDHFQNFKRYQIPKAQLIIADMPYNLGNNAYASNPAWYKNGDNKYLNAIHCSDKLISKFINNIKGIINKDTLIVISSDHLAMKNSASNKINHLNRNNLFILNHKTNIIPEKSNKNGSIIDMGATILDYLDTGIYELGLGRSL